MLREANLIKQLINSICSSLLVPFVLFLNLNPALALAYVKMQTGIITSTIIIIVIIITITPLPLHYLSGVHIKHP